MTVRPSEGRDQPSVADGNIASGENGKDPEITLGPSRADLVASVARAGLALVPWTGPILAELIGNVIPNQRIERLEQFVRQLRDRVEDLRHIAEDPRRVDLFEDGCFLTIRAVQKERIEHIVEVVSRGLSGSEKELIEARRMMRLLAEIDVDQVILMESKIYGRLPAALKLHPDIVRKPVVNLGSGQDQRDLAALADARELHLVRLGLLTPKFGKPKNGEVPEFDARTGMMKAQGTKLTRLGLLLLRYLDLADEKSHST